MASTVGGRVDITLNGVPYSMVADVEIDEANIEAEVVDNQDGTIGRSVKSSHYEVDLKFRHKPGFSLEQIMNATIDFSMVERDTGQTVIMTGAFLVGKPKRNTVTGEISGLKLAADNQRRTSRP